MAIDTALQLARVLEPSTDMNPNAIATTAPEPSAKNLNALALRFSSYLLAAVTIWYPGHSEALTIACPKYFATGSPASEPAVEASSAPTLWGVSARLTPAAADLAEGTLRTTTFRGHFQGSQVFLTVRMGHQLEFTRYPANRRDISGNFAGPTELEVSDAAAGGPRLIAGNIMGFRMRVVTSTAPNGRSAISGHITRAARQTTGLFASWFDATPTSDANVRHIKGKLDDFNIDVHEHRLENGDVRLVGKLGDENVDDVVPWSEMSPQTGFLMGGLLGPVLSPELSRYPDLMWYALLAMARARR